METKTNAPSRDELYSEITRISDHITELLNAVSTADKYEKGKIFRELSFFSGVQQGLVYAYTGDNALYDRDYNEYYNNNNNK